MDTNYNLLLLLSSSLIIGAVVFKLVIKSDTLAYTLLSLAVMTIVYYELLRQMQTHESFAQADRISTTSSVTPDITCKSITEKITGNDSLQGIMSRKVLQVRNDGQNFRYFNDKTKTFNNDSQYCYVNTFDYLDKVTPPSCDKTDPTYNFAMIKDVQLGAVQEKGDVVPKQVCIMELDPIKANQPDVLQFSSMVNEFDNKSIVDSIEQCQSDLDQRTQQYKSLMEANHDLDKRNKELFASLEQCTAQTDMYLNQNTILSAEVQAHNKVVLVDSYKLSRQIVIDIDLGVKTFAIPQEFQIGYAFMPYGYKLKIIRSDGAFQTIDRSTLNYPRVDSTIGNTASRVDVIFPSH